MNATWSHAAHRESHCMWNKLCYCSERDSECVVIADSFFTCTASKSQSKPCQVSWLGKIMLSSAIRGAQLVGLGVCSFGGNSFKFQLFFTSRDNLPLDIVSHQPEVVLVADYCASEKLNSNRSCSAVEVFSYRRHASKWLITAHSLRLIQNDFIFSSPWWMAWCEQWDAHQESRDTLEFNVFICSHHSSSSHMGDGRESEMS